MSMAYISVLHMGFILYKEKNVYFCSFDTALVVGVFDLIWFGFTLSTGFSGICLASQVVHCFTYFTNQNI